MKASNSPAVADTEATDIPGNTPEPRRKAKRAAPKRRRNYLPAAERRRSIIQAAQGVFSHTSLQGARTRDLAKAAGINQATLYGHFDSKDDLFVAAVVQPLLDVMRGMHERAETYESARSADELLVLAQASCRNHLATVVEIYPLLTAALFADPALGKKLYCEKIAPLFAERGKAMRNVVKDGVDPELLALAAFGMFLAVAMDRHFKDGTEDLSALARQLTNLAAFGFAPDRLRN